MSTTATISAFKRRTVTVGVLLQQQRIQLNKKIVTPEKTGFHHTRTQIDMNKIYALLAGFLLAGSAFAAVNITTATKSELEALPEVGPARAQAIIDYRTKNGPFKTGEDLKKVDGVGDKNFMEMKDKIATSGPTKIDWKSDAKKDAPKAADAAKTAAPAAAAGAVAAPKADAGKAAAPTAAAAAAPAAAPKAAAPVAPAAAAKDAPKAADKPMSKEEKAAADKAKKEADKKAKADAKAKKEADKKAKADEAKAKKEADAKAKKDAAKAKEAPAKAAAPKADAPKAEAKKEDTPKKP